MKRGEIWWVNFDPSTGSEIRKIRPAIVVSNDTANSVLDRIQVVPITSQRGKVYPSETIITIKGKKNKAMADQLATASKDRVSSYITSLSLEEMQGVERAIKQQLALA